MTDKPGGFGSGVLAGVVGGFLLGAVIFRGLVFGPGPATPLPAMSFLLVALTFATLWIVLIAGAIRWLFNPRGQQAGRLADLPADFDDWHRRAHAQMDREAAAGAGGTQP
jgi:hypothetical protein